MTVVNYNTCSDTCRGKPHRIDAKNTESWEDHGGSSDKEAASSSTFDAIIVIYFIWI
jgi:hypothetical protein